MKKYKLKQWYPSLGSTWIVGDIAVKSTWDYYYRAEYPNGYLSTETEVENNPDFWELIEEKKSLFMTADKVEIFEGDKFILVTDNFIKHEVVAHNVLYGDGIYRAFKHEFSADKYILWNKPLFSLQDIDATFKVHLPEFIDLIRLAEERLNNDNNELVIECFKSRAFDKRANEL